MKKKKKKKKQFVKQDSLTRDLPYLEYHMIESMA